MRPTVTPIGSGINRVYPSRVTPHALECEIHRRLSTHPGLRLDSLVVHRTPSGVCLEGRVEMLEEEVDVRELLTDIDGIGEVINRLMPAAPGLCDEVVTLWDSAECESGYHHG